MKTLSSTDITAMLSRDNLSQPKILIIEDCLADTALLKHTINDYYPLTLIDHVETLHEAREKLRATEYDIVFLDLNLPDTKNLSDIAEIRIQCPQTPLIIVTGSCTPLTIDAARHHNANGIIGKADMVASPFTAVMQGAVNNVICV